MTYLPEARRQLIGAAERRAARRLVIPPPRLAWVAPALSLAVAAAVAIAFLSVRTQPPARPATHPARHLRLVYLPQSTAQVPVLAHVGLARAMKDLNLRLAQIPHSHASVQIVSGHLLQVDVTTRIALARVEAVLGSDAQLQFYDWEANVLAPNGRTAASGLPDRRAALELSQGSAAAPPGSSGSGARSLYQAVKLASRQPYAPSRDNSRVGSEYYLFAPDGQRLAGPLDPGQASRRTALRELKAGLTGAQRRQGRVLVIKQGTVVLEAAPASFRVAGKFGAPGAGYYVLRDHVALFGNDITNPRSGTDSSGVPDVNFGFTRHGADAFWRLTAAVARRGELFSIGSQQLFQHFAIALGNRLIDVSQIDYTIYPDGLAGVHDAEITSGFTRSGTHGLATALRLDALRVNLKLLSAR